MILQIAFLSAYPIWSAIIIAIQVFVLYALTAKWDEVELAPEGLGGHPFRTLVRPLAGRSVLLPM